MTELPQPAPQPPAVPEPQDTPYCGTLRLHVDATDVRRRIYRAHQTIPVAKAGSMMLLYPKWLPGFHAPQAPIELFAGLRITAAGEELAWKRHPVAVNAFCIEVPEGAHEIEAEFQFLSPTAPDQGRVIATESLLTLQWNSVLLYPAGHFARQIDVAAELTLPEGWAYATALDEEERAGDVVRFAPVSLDRLVDSPVFAGAHQRRLALGDKVHLNLFAEQPEWLDASDEQIAAHAAVVTQCDRLFAARHFDRFEMLLALSGELTSAGVEHHQSFEAVTLPTYFSDWEGTFVRRDTVPHEYVHSWNGKHRRGGDSWSPCFELPIRNDLMWVYEGQTQYWSRVLCARSGLWDVEQARGALALTAATYEVRPGSNWRPIFDTTRDPIIAARAPLPWTSWQRSEDYYAEGALLWLDVDTRIRELSGERRSLDDFARAFFGQNAGQVTTDLYWFEDVVAALEQLAPFGWHDWLEEQLDAKRQGALLGGLERGGYRLVYRDTPSSFLKSCETVFGTINHLFSIGLTLKPDGEVSEVLWDGPAFRAGLTVGSRIVGVNGRSFAPEALVQAIDDSRTTGGVELVERKGSIVRDVECDYQGGLRYPQLARIGGVRARLDEIWKPLD